MSDLIELVQGLIDNALDMDKRCDEILREVIAGIESLQARNKELESLITRTLIAVPRDLPQMLLDDMKAALKED